jgi:hypothetical protein
MHDIEQKVNLFLESVCEGKTTFSEDLIQEFGERCKDILRNSFKEQPTTERTFYLRMSNVGRSLRQLMLAKTNLNAWKPNKEFKLKSTIGHLYEAFFLAVMKQAGVNIIDQDKRVSMMVGDVKLEGTYDVKIDGKIYDIKTASPYSYDYKFQSLEKLREGDSFGYFAQGFGYAIADKSPFGGWIAINKVTGEFKVLEIPKYEHNALAAEYNKQICVTVKHVTTSNEIPPCCGIVEEIFFKKKTGNKILAGDCLYCDHKTTICHKDNITVLPDVNSKSLNAKIKFYIGRVIRP